MENSTATMGKVLSSINIKERLILEIEQAPEESLIKFMELWQLAKQASNHPDNSSSAYTFITARNF